MESKHRNFIKLLLTPLLVIFFLLTSCGGMGYFKTQGPSIISFTPLLGLGNVSNSLNIQFRFNEAVTNVNPSTAYYVVLSSGITDPIGDALVQTTFNFTTEFNSWVWQSGSSLTNQAGIYGTQGIPSLTNALGGRSYDVSWKDSSGYAILYYYDEQADILIY